MEDKFSNRPTKYAKYIRDMIENGKEAIEITLEGEKFLTAYNSIWYFLKRHNLADRLDVVRRENLGKIYVINRSIIKKENQNV